MRDEEAPSAEQGPRRPIHDDNYDDIYERQLPDDNYVTIER